MRVYRRNLAVGRTFDLDQHPYLAEVYAGTKPGGEPDREVVYLKAAQVGISEYLISWILYMASEQDATGLYVMPTDRHVGEFSTARLGLAIDAKSSPALAALITPATTGQRGSDRVSLKRVGDRFVYFRGGQIADKGQTQHASQLRSIDADALVLDELDEMDPRVPAISRARLEHSLLGQVRIASTPTFADQGIYALYQSTTMHRWQVKCLTCQRWQVVGLENLVSEWDALDRPTVWNGQDDDRPYLACVHCHDPLPRDSSGHWEAEYPKRDVVGYHIHGLASPRKSLVDILTGLQSTDETTRQQTYNQGLGETYRPRDSERLTESVLNDCRREYLLGEPVANESTYAGIDVGRVLHVIVRAKLPNGDRVLRYAQQLSTFDEALYQLQRWSVKVCVIDALPETRKSRELQSRLPRLRLWLSYFNRSADGAKTEGPAKWNAKDLEVDVDRTRALDATLALFHNAALCNATDGSPLPGNTLPANARALSDYYLQLMSPERILTTDARGNRVPTYVNSKPDHYAFAEAYAHIAMLCPYQGWSRGTG